jgi:hypothetical protein
MRTITLDRDSFNKFSLFMLVPDQLHDFKDKSRIKDQILRKNLNYIFSRIKTGGDKRSLDHAYGSDTKRKRIAGLGEITKKDPIKEFDPIEEFCSKIDELNRDLALRDDLALHDINYEDGDISRALLKLLGRSSEKTIQNEYIESGNNFLNFFIKLIDIDSKNRYIDLEQEGGRSRRVKSTPLPNNKTHKKSHNHVKSVPLPHNKTRKKSHNRVKSAPLPQNKTRKKSHNRVKSAPLPHNKTRKKSHIKIKSYTLKGTFKGGTLSDEEKRIKNDLIDKVNKLLTSIKDTGITFENIDELERKLNCNNSTTTRTTIKCYKTYIDILNIVSKIIVEVTKIFDELEKKYYSTIKYDNLITLTSNLDKNYSLNILPFRYCN